MKRTNHEEMHLGCNSESKTVWIWLLKISDGAESKMTKERSICQPSFCHLEKDGIETAPDGDVLLRDVDRCRRSPNLTFENVANVRERRRATSTIIWGQKVHILGFFH
jgi:hypothetical protein